MNRRRRLRFQVVRLLHNRDIHRLCHIHFTEEPNPWWGVIHAEVDAGRVVTNFSPTRRVEWHS